MKKTIIALVASMGLFGTTKAQTGTTVFTDDYSNASNWTQVSGNYSPTRVTVTNGRVEAVNVQAFNFQNRIFRQIPNNTTIRNEDSWQIETEIRNNTAAGQFAAYIPLSLSSNNRDLLTNCTDGNPNVQCNTINTTNRGLAVSVNTNATNVDEISFLIINGESAPRSLTIARNATYFIRLSKLLNTITLSVFTNAARTTQIVGSPITLTTNITLDNYNFIQHGITTFGGSHRRNSFTVDNTNMVLYSLCEARQLAGLSNAPTAFAPVPLQAVCSGNAINYTVTPVPGANSYVWRIDGNVVAGASTNVLRKTWTAAEAGNHVVSVAAVSTCGTSTFLTRNVAVTATPVVPAITGNANVCVGLTLPLDNAIANGVWSTSNAAIATVSQRAVVTGVSAGVANITFRVTNGACSGTATRAITVNGTPSLVINGSNTVCPNTNGNPYNVTPAIPGYNYTWSVLNNEGISVNYVANNTSNTKVNVPELSGSPQFTLTCKGEDACGRSFTVSKIITLNPSVVAPNLSCAAPDGNGNDCPNLSVTNNAGYTVNWNVGGTLYSNVTTVQRPIGANVTVTYTSSALCKKSTYRNATTICNSFRLADEIDISSDKPFAIYPNPAKGAFVIQTKGQAGTASIYDVTGHLVKEVDLYESQNSYNVEISTAGVYTIHVKTATEKKGYKIVIE
jgi:hypothetical protein